MSCLDCNRGSILEGQPTGSFTDIDGVKVYLASSTGNGRQGGRAVILLGDGFGLPLVNSHLTLEGAGFAIHLLTEHAALRTAAFGREWDDRQPPAEATAPLGQDKIRCHDSTAAQWAYASVIDPRNIARIREQWKYDRIGAVGYCFGGPLGVRLAPLDIFDSLVVCHPGWVSEAEVKAINVPTSWVCAEEDITFGPAIRNQAEALLAAREGKDDFVDYEFVDYKGTVHGFACRPPLEFPDVKEAFEKSIDQTLKWFEKTLLVT